MHNISNITMDSVGMIAAMIGFVGFMLGRLYGMREARLIQRLRVNRNQMIRENRSNRGNRNNRGSRNNNRINRYPSSVDDRLVDSYRGN